MKKLSLLVLSLVMFTMYSWGQVSGRLAPAVVPNADVLAYVSFDKIGASAFAQAVMAESKKMESEEWYMKWQEENGDFMAMLQPGGPFDNICKALGIKREEFGKLFKSAVFSLSMNGATSMDIAQNFDKLDVVFGLELTQSLDIGMIHVLAMEGLKGVGVEADELEIQRGTFGGAPILTLVSKEEEVPAPLKRLVLAKVGADVFLFGPERCIQAAVTRMNGGKATAVAPFFNKIRGDIALGVRMLPDMKAMLSGMGAENPALANVGNGEGFSLTMNYTDKIQIALKAYLAKAEDAMMFKTQVWDAQFGMLAAMFTAGIKEESGGKMTCFDTLKCVAEGNAVVLNMDFTLNDVQGIYEILRRSTVKPAAPAPAPAP